MREKDQQEVFGFVDQRNLWEKEWQDMPEYKHEDQRPYKTLYIRFETLEDLKNFEKIFDQPIFPNEKSYWYPKAAKKMVSKKRYVDEDES